MKTNLILLIVFITIAGGWTYWRSNLDSPQAPETTKVVQQTSHEQIADFELTLLSGDKKNLYEIKEKTILIHFWATWCAPCLVEFPELVELAKQTKNEIVILAISVNEKHEDIDRFLKKLDLKLSDNFLIAHDPEKIISQDQFKTIKLPESFILTPDYKLHKKIIGAYDDWLSEETLSELKKLKSHYE